MAHYLLKKGYNLVVYNRTASKADDLVAAGAKFMSPKEIAEQSDYLFLMLGYPHDVEQMTIDPQEGILKHMKSGSYLIDHTTSKPGLAQKIYEEAKKVNVQSIDAPVSGGDTGARNGCLVVMVGGESEAVEHVRPLFDCFSAKV